MSPLRVLMCTYDRRGLGRTARTLEIASALANQIPGSSILVLTNLSIVGRFRAPEHVDVIRVPGIGPAASAGSNPGSFPVDLERTLSVRRHIAQATIETFRPDLVVVERDPAHMPSEMRSVLGFVREKLPRTRIVWALPDVLGDPQTVCQDWTRQDVFATLDRLCDEIWVYGVRGVFDQGREYHMPKSIVEKVHYTGYLRPPATPPHRIPSDLLRAHPNRPLVLVTAGGGASGYPLISSYLDFLEHVNGSGEFQSVVITGPMMPPGLNARLGERARKLPHVIFHRFSKHMLEYLRHCQLAISRGGYNTLCAHVSYRKPSILVPDAVPPHEHMLRARVFGRLRWCGIVGPGELSSGRLGEYVTSALSGGSQLPRPESAERVSLDGHARIGERVRALAAPQTMRRHGPRAQSAFAGVRKTSGG